MSFLRGSANDWTSGFELIRDLVIDALSDDRGGLVYVNRAGSGVAELIRYRSGVVTVDLDQNTGEPFYKINNRSVAAADMIHLRAPFGKAPLTLAREAIGGYQRQFAGLREEERSLTPAVSSTTMPKTMRYQANTVKSWFAT